MAEAKVELKEIYPVPDAVREKAYIKSRAEYDKLYKRSIEDPEGFWGEVAEETVEWFKKWDGKVEDYNFDFRKGDIYLKYFAGGKLNVSYNCLDRHLATRGDKVAIQWRATSPAKTGPILIRNCTKRSASLQMSSSLTGSKRETW